ncbi:MAG: GAF domain-containing protein [Chloroflexi bacterium]|nr:GAF domain-containing protein [Chloroflexota bacterium]
MDKIFPYATIAHLVSGIGFVLSTWLGAYLVSRAPRSFPSRLAILSLFALSAYFLHTVLCLFIPADQIGHLWRRYLGWFSLVPLPIWMHLTTALLSPARRGLQQVNVYSAYGVCGLLSLAWAFGPWSFSRHTLLPPELVLPITLFTIGVGGSALYTAWKLRQQAADRTLRKRYTVLAAFISLLVLGVLYWPVTVTWMMVDWTPTTRLMIGDSIPLAASALLAYAIAYHNAFMAGRWVRQDFYLNALTVGGIALVYMVTVISTYNLASAFNFDAPTITFIAVVGLSVFTHLLAERSRSWRDNLFFKQMRALPGEMSSLVNEARMLSGQLDDQMRALVNRLAELTGASTACIALYENEQLVIRASTDREHLNQCLPIKTSSDGLLQNLRSTEHNGPQQRFRWDCLVLAEPIMVESQTVGYLLLGERGMGEGYDREERVWVSTLSAYLGTAFEQAQRREETERTLAALNAEVQELTMQEQSLQREFESLLSGSLPSINRQELREAIYAYNRPDRLAALLSREDSTLSTLPSIHRNETPPAQAFQQQLASVLDSMSPPPDLLPPLETIRDRAMRHKRRRQLPSTVADYYTLKLIMAGYTHESAAEVLDVSPRQVRNYIDRAIDSVKTLLERESQKTSSNFR